MRASKGFSIIELVIAISLSSFVLVGVATIAAQMARSQIEGIRSGTVTGWSLVSYLAMSKELEDANVLVYPQNNLESRDAVVVCKNWSRIVGGKLDTNAPGRVTVTQYCVDNTDPTNLILRRYSSVGAGVTCPLPGAGPVACVAAPGGGWTEIGVVGLRLEKLGGSNVFTRDNSIGGLRVRYVIGRQTATTNEPIVKFTPFDIGIGMSKQYNNNLD